MHAQPSHVSTSKVTLCIYLHPCAPTCVCVHIRAYVQTTLIIATLSIFALGGSIKHVAERCEAQGNSSSG